MALRTVLQHDVSDVSRNKSTAVVIHSIVGVRILKSFRCTGFEGTFLFVIWRGGGSQRGGLSRLGGNFRTLHWK